MTQSEWPEIHERDSSRLRTVIRRITVAIVIVVVAGASFFYAYRETGIDAAIACMKTVQSKPMNYTASSVEFEIFGRGGIGWECYAYGNDLTKHHIISLGLRPSFVDLPIGTDT